MHQALASLAEIMSGAPLLVLQAEIDPNGAITLSSVGGSTEDVLGCAPEWLEAAPNRLFALIETADRGALELLLARAVVGSTPTASTVVSLAHPAGGTVRRRIILQRRAATADAAVPVGTPALWSVFVVPAEAGDPVADAAAHSEDFARLVDRAVAAELSRVTETASVDALTGLPNRSGLRRRCLDLLEAVDVDGDPAQLAFLQVDLDRFRAFNDTYGPHVGDAALAAVGQALMQAAGKEALVGRLEQDTFLVVSDCHGRRHHPWTLARDLLDIFDRPFRAGDTDVYLSASIGVTAVPEIATQFEAILDKLDRATRSAKANGRRTFVVLRADTANLAAATASLEMDLRAAVQQQSQLEVYYQPQISLQNGKLLGIEALTRWRHPEKGLIAPDAFIPLAEETGLIVHLGDWLMQTACAHAVSLFQGRFSDLRLAVNLSPVQFRDATLRDRIASALTITGLPPSCLELEITESSLMHDTRAVADTLSGLARFGLSVAVDDFGTGYSSLSYLKNLPVDALKLDKSFVAGIPEDRADVAICAGVISIAKGLGLSVVAEGVETEAQAELLSEMGCHVGQGFLYSRPMPVRDLRGWLDKTYPQGQDGA